MDSKASSVKKTSVVLICLLIVGLVAVAATLISITTDSGAAWARGLLGDTGNAATRSQDIDSGGPPSFNDAIQDHVEQSQEQLHQRIQQVPRSDKEVEEHTESSLREIEAHIDWSEEALVDHIRRSRERFENIAK